MGGDYVGGEDATAELLPRQPTQRWLRLLAAFDRHVEPQLGFNRSVRVVAGARRSRRVLSHAE